MYLKKLPITLVLVLLSLLMLPSGIIMAANGGLMPHEDPKSAELHFDGVAILDHYTLLLDTVLARAPIQTELLHEKAPFANIPEGLEQSLKDFGNASVNISRLIPKIEADLDYLNMLASQFRVEELEAQWPQTQGNLTHAYGLFSVIEECAVIAGEELGVPSSDSGSPLAMAYEELDGRLEQLHKLLALLQALLKAMQELSWASLPTEITLELEPTRGFVGDWIDFRGSLGCKGAGLPNREVTLLVDGVPYLSSQTGQDGSYQGQMQIPYRYVPHLTIQALYCPQGSDINIYLASRSSPIEIELLYYTATVHLEIRDKSYPGLDTTLHGRFDYGDQPVPAARDIQVYLVEERIPQVSIRESLKQKQMIYLDKKLLSQASVGESFEHKVPLGPETALGEHRLLVSVPAQERYAPVEYETTLNVVKAPLTIDVSPPRVAIMPFAVSLEGRIYSELGPVGGAVVEASLGNLEAQAITSAEGKFTIKLGTGMTFSLIGSQNLSLNVDPREPWNSPASLSRGLVAINPILIGFLTLALGLIIAALAKRLRIKSTRPVPEGVTVSPEVAPTKPANAHGIPASFPTRSQREVKGPRQLTFELYRRLLRLIQDFTSIVLKPHLTLREFATQCAPLLGPAYKYLDQFTRLIERLLYSKHVAEPADLEKGQELSGLVEESLKHERA